MNTVAFARTSIQLVWMIIASEPAKNSHFWIFMIPRVLNRFEWFKCQLKAKRSKYFCDFSCCLTSNRSIGKFNFIQISWLCSCSVLWGSRYSPPRGFFNVFLYQFRYSVVQRRVGSRDGILLLCFLLSKFECQISFSNIEFHFRIANFECHSVFVWTRTFFIGIRKAAFSKQIGIRLDGA